MKQVPSIATQLSLLLLWMGQATAQTPDDAAMRGRALLDRGEYAAAVEAYTSAIQRDATLSDAFYGRGMASGLMKDYDAAIRDFSVAVQLNPAMAGAYRNRGLACMKKVQDLMRSRICLKPSNLSQETLSGT